MIFTPKFPPLPNKVAEPNYDHAGLTNAWAKNNFASDCSRQKGKNWKRYFFNFLFLYQDISRNITQQLLKQTNTSTHAALQTGSSFFNKALKNKKNCTNILKSNKKILKGDLSTQGRQTKAQHFLGTHRAGLMSPCRSSSINVWRVVASCKRCTIRWILLWLIVRHWLEMQAHNMQTIKRIILIPFYINNVKIGSLLEHRTR